MTRFMTGILFALLLPLPAMPAAPQHSYDWRLRKDMKGIQVFTRGVPGSPSQEFKAVTEMESSLAGVLKLMEDIESYPEWLPNLREVKLVKILNSQELVIYQRMKVPFPAQDRDSFFKVTALRDPGTGAAILRLTSLWDFEPELKNVVRVKNLSGSWTFMPARGKDAVTVTYQMHTEPGGSLPAWMANASVVKRPFTILLKMREILKNPRYRDARTSELRLFSPLMVLNSF